MSILVGLSGSQNAEDAARTGWDIARRLNCRVVAEHVIDTTVSDKLLNPVKNGLLDHETLLNTHSQILKSQQEIADKLKEKYMAAFSSFGLSGECVIDSGNPVEKLTEKSNHHDLVIIGHKKEKTEPGLKWNTLSKVSSGLAHTCSKPLLVLLGKTDSWKRLVMVVSQDHTNPQYIRSCLSLAKLLGLVPEIVCVACESEIEDLDIFRKHLRKTLPELEKIDISMTLVKGKDADEKIELWSRADTPVNISLDDKSLLVVPTRLTRNIRYTIFGEQASDFLNHLTLPKVLLWPLEYEVETADSRLYSVSESDLIHNES